MAIQKKNAFSRRLPDLVTEELVSVLSQKKSFEFKQLFEVVHENLRQRNAASGGEEMLRLRAYEKLQNLVARGVVKKTGKSYKGDAAALAAMAATNAQTAATVVSKTEQPEMAQDYLPILVQVIFAAGFAGFALFLSVLIGRVGKRTQIKD